MNRTDSSGSKANCTDHQILITGSFDCLLQVHPDLRERVLRELLQRRPHRSTGEGQPNFWRDVNGERQNRLRQNWLGQSRRERCCLEEHWPLTVVLLDPITLCFAIPICAGDFHRLSRRQAHQLTQTQHQVDGLWIHVDCEGLLRAAGCEGRNNDEPIRSETDNSTQGPSQKTLKWTHQSQSDKELPRKTLKSTQQHGSSQEPPRETLKST